MSDAALYIGCTSVRPSNDGIGRVARLIARALSDPEAGRNWTVRGVSLSADGSATSGAFVSANDSRIRFLSRVTAATLTHDAFLYDGPGMARAHGWLPFPRRPYLTWIHGIESWPGTAHPKQVAAQRRADELVAITAYSKARAAAYEPTAERATVCWLATVTDDPPAASKRTDGPPRVTILGRVDANSYKGHPELLRAWPRVRAAVPDAILTVAGSGPGLDEQKRLAAALGLDDRAVEFRGFVPEDHIDALWAESTVFAMPSRGEGFGLVYIEAMRWGIPVIASVHDAGQEVNVHGESGFNVDLDDPDDLADRLDRTPPRPRPGRGPWLRRVRPVAKTFSIFRVPRSVRADCRPSVDPLARRRAYHVRHRRLYRDRPRPRP